MKLFLKTISILLLMFVFLCPVAFATNLDGLNWSFDDSPGTPTTDGTGTHSTGISYWDYAGDGVWGVWTPTEDLMYATGLPDDSPIGYLNDGTISQTTNHEILANNVLTLSLDIGNRDDRPLPDYTVYLMAGNEILDEGSVQPVDGFFSDLTLSYTVLDGDPNLNKFLGIVIDSEGAQLNFDNLRVSNDSTISANAVPEPASMLLLGTGLLGLVGYGRKKKFFKK